MERMASYSQIIKDLRSRSGLGVREYAEAVGLSTTHMSNILNDTQPGSLKSLLACLRYANIDIQECIELPESREELDTTLRTAKDLLARHDHYAERLRDFIDDTHRRAIGSRQRSKSRPKFIVSRNHT